MSNNEVYKVLQAYVPIDKSGKKALINADQAVAHNWRATRKIAPVNGIDTAILNNSSSYLEARIKGGAYDNLRHLTLKIALTISTSSTVISPIWKWFKKLTISQDGTDDLYTIPAAALEYLLLLAHNTAQQMQLAKMAGGNPDDICSQPNAKAVGVHVFELPIMASFLRKMDIDFSSAKGDLVLRFYPTGNIAYASDSSNCAISNVSIIVDNSDVNADKVQVAGYNTTVSVPKSIDSNNYLNWMTLENPSNSITCGSVNTIELGSVKGKVPFILFCIRPAGYTNASGSNTFYNLADKTLSSSVGTLDIVNASGETQIGNGTALTSNYVRSEMMHQSDSSVVYKKPIYCLNFGTSIARSLDGKLDGFFQFNPSHDYSLQFTPQQSVQEVHTLSGTALANGNLRIKWRNEISPPVAYNASTATLATTFAALKVAQSSNTTCAFSATFAAGTSVTATFTTPEISVGGDLIEVLVSEATQWTSAVTTSGFAGLPSSTSYCTQVMVLYSTVLFMKMVLCAITPYKPFYSTFIVLSFFLMSRIYNDFNS